MGPLYRASLNKFYFDEIFWAILVAPLRGVAGLAFELVRSKRHRFDCRRRCQSAALVEWGADRFPKRGVPSYALVMWMGLLVCLVFYQLRSRISRTSLSMKIRCFQSC